MASLETLLAERPWLLADGATGTNLFAIGLEAGEAPELWNETEPAKIRALYDGAVGAWSDRSGPVWPLTVSVGLFVTGLIVSGLAPTMEILVIGRLVQRGRIQAAVAQVDPTPLGVENAQGRQRGRPANHHLRLVPEARLGALDRRQPPQVGSAAEHVLDVALLRGDLLGVRPLHQRAGAAAPRGVVRAVHGSSLRDRA